MTTTTAPHDAPVGGWALRDVVALAGRSLRRSLRNLDAVILGAALPVLVMVMFVFVFGGAIDAGMAYVDYVVPGIFLLSAGFGASATAVAVAGDMTGGMMSRFRTLAVRPTAVLTGHVVESVARNAVSMVLVVAVALASGFRPTATLGQWLATLALVGGYVLALTWVAVGIGISASGPEGASGASFSLSFLPYISSAFVQPDTMPRVLEVIARYQPVTPITDTVRAWLTGAGTPRPIVAFAWVVGTVLVARTVALVQLRRRAVR